MTRIENNYNPKFNSILPHNAHTQQTKSNLDSGYTAHNITKNKVCTNKTPIKIRKKVLLSNGYTMQSTHQASLNIPNLSEEANKCEIFPELTIGALVSVVQLCDTGHTVSFSKENVTIREKDSIKLIGKWYKSSSLWKIPLGQQLANGVINTLNNTKRQLVDYFHAVCFRPEPHTFIKAIKKVHFSTWPGLPP